MARTAGLGGCGWIAQAQRHLDEEYPASAALVHQGQKLVKLPCGIASYPVNPQVGDFTGGFVGGHTFGKAAQVFNRDDSQRRGQRPQLAQSQFPSLLVGTQKPGIEVFIDRAVRVGCQGPSDAVDTRQPRERFVQQYRQCAEIAARKTLVDFADLRFDQMKIVNQPFCGGADVVPDTLAALRHAQGLGMTNTLTICNVATSAMVRECKLSYITRAGIEIGVASTKAFTAQLAGLFLLTLVLAKTRGRLSAPEEQRHLKAMRHLPAALSAVLALEPQIIAWAEDFAKMENALFLGRGLHYPIAMEGALKLKEISYIHAEAYPAGELKHGPLALVTSAMPVVTVAPNDVLLEKLKSNLHEVRARGGVLYVLADAGSKIESGEGMHVIRMPEHYGELSPMLHVVPLQLLAYHTACARGTDVDKPRNLAKSVTVE